MPRFDVTLTRPDATRSGAVTAGLDARDANEAAAAARRGHPGYLVADVSEPHRPLMPASAERLPPVSVCKPR